MPVCDWPGFMAATYNELLLVSGGEVQTLHRGEGQYYGISWDSRNIYIAHKKDNYTPGPEVSVLDRDFGVVGIVPGVFPDVHQILYVKGKLYITNTGGNRVDSFDGNVLRHHNWTKHTTGVNHINSIFYDGFNFWSCHHNLVSRGDHTYSDLVCLSPDLSKIERSIRVGFDLHNVFISGERLYTLSSAEGDLLELSLVSGEIYRRTHIGMWPRGFAATSDSFLVGVSTKIDRSNRPDGRSEVHLVDRNTLSVIDVMRIDNVGVMHEIRVVSEKDYAHNGIVFPGRL